MDGDIGAIWQMPLDKTLIWVGRRIEKTMVAFDWWEDRANMTRGDLADCGVNGHGYLDLFDGTGHTVMCEYVAIDPDRAAAMWSRILAEGNSTSASNEHT